VKLLLDISAEHFERILGQITEQSRLHSILMNSIVVYDHQDGLRKKVVKILCKASDADKLLDAAKTLCPEAAVEIEKSIAERHQAGGS